MCAAGSDLISFNGLTIVDLLEADQRPTFVVHAATDLLLNGQAQPIFLNSALRKRVDLSKQLFNTSTDAAGLRNFNSWIQNSARAAGSTHRYAGVEWCSTTINSSWLVIGANHVTPVSHGDALSQSLVSFPGWSQPEDSDWTHITDSTQYPEYVRYLRNQDWSSTALGSMSTWSAELRLLVNLILRTKVPHLIYWGRDLTAVYNEAFIPIAGGKHPQLLGGRCEEVWSDNWEFIRDVFRQMYETGAAIEVQQCVMVQRSGFIEEAYFDYSSAPIIGEKGVVLGYRISVHEVTKTILAERRLKTTDTLHQRIAGKVTIEELYSRFLDTLDANKEDITFATIYTADTDTSNAGLHTEPDQELQRVHLRGAVGLTQDILPPVIGDKSASGSFGLLLKIVRNPVSRTLLQNTDEALCEIRSEVIVPERGHGAGLKQAVLYPLRGTSNDELLGFLLIGLNARRPYDQDYEQFTNSLSAQFNDALNTTIRHQKELRQQQQQANEQRIILQERLAQQTRETKAMEQRFTRLTTVSPALVSIGRLDGTIKYANDEWLAHFASDGDQFSAASWLDRIYPEDREMVARVFFGVGIDSDPVINCEFRTRTPWKSVMSDDVQLPYTWLMGNCYTDVSEDGKTVEFISTSIDITHQKWMQQESQKRTEEVLEAKRQQDAFTDMVAHEIRNPLNAVVQCADLIQASLRSLQDKSGHVESIQESIENAETIMYCAMHQKKIIDDLLTLSKLDSDLLSFTPVSSRPSTILTQTVKMFEAEAQAHKIALDLNIHQSLAQNHVDLMMLDPQRISQVLINLITNAIKFTKGRSVRSVKVSLEASTDHHLFKNDHGFKFFPTNRARSLAEPSPDELFLLFSIRDTGPGISEAVGLQLFQRFSQASLRTHIEYGGSGLGLWISRELAEMQGGEIGFKTNSEGGTTFAFYIRARPAPSSLSTPTSLPPMIAQDSVQVQSNGQLPGSRQSRGEMRAPQSNDVMRQSDLKTINVLLTEDNLINQKIMKKQLEKIFKNVLIANDGQEAIEIIKRSHNWKETSTADAKADDGAGTVDVVLMDIEMPVLNGVDCTKRIRHFEAQGKISPRIPIIAVSANARVEQVIEYQKAGMDDALSKPFVVRDLVALVNRIL